MSKKLIAVASATALALSALVGIAPAQALLVVVGDPGNSAEIAVSNTLNRASGAGSVASPVSITVPDAGTVGASDILTLTISSTILRTAVTATVTNGIKLLDAPGDATNKYTSASGTTAMPATAATNSSGAFVFYAFPTSTTTGVLTVTIGTDITQIYIKGSAGVAYDVTSVTLPTVEPKATGTVIATVTDAFGNAIEGSVVQTVTLSRVGGTGGDMTKAISYSATTKRWEAELVAPNAAGQVAYSASVAGLTATKAQTDAFGEPQTFFGLTSFSSTAELVTALRAQVATLTASVTALTADYNKLAKRWNKKVANKKTLKKKVALK